MARVPLVAVLTAAVLAVASAPASAALSIPSFSVTPSTTAAAAHPDVSITAGLAGDDVKDVKVHLPPGLIGNPKAAPTCTDAQFNASTCPAASRVGDATVVANATIIVPITVTATGGVFNLVPHAGEPARLGTIVHATDPIIGPLTDDVRVQFPVTLRPGDFGLDTTISDLPNTVGSTLGPQHITITSLGFTLHGMVGGAPFMTNPTSCGAANTTVDADGYGSPGTTVSAASSYTPTACDAVPFAPAMGIALETTKSDVPSGYTVSLTVPGAETPLRQSHIKRAEVVLPEGTTLSPGVADGVETCSDDQFGVGKDAPPDCPSGSQIGTVSFDTPLLGSLSGKVFFGTPSGSNLRVLVSVEDPASGVRIKAPGSVTVDSNTGQLRTVVDNLPQVPFTTFKLSFNGGPKAVLANPSSCGTFTTSARLTPWSGGADATPSATFTIDNDGNGGGCPAKRPFSPSLSVQASSTQAGGPTGSLTLTVNRPDRDQRLRSMAISLPPGLAGQIVGLPTCPDDKAASGDCPDNSRVGTVRNTVGTGDAPITLTGPVFLGGPYKGGLASIIAVVPAKVGPLDLGKVVLRNALSLRPGDGGVDVRSDDLPAFVSGIPVVVRSLAITLDKPGMLNNPTACANLPVVGKFTAAGGDTATATAGFQPTGCDKLPFGPKVSAVIGAQGETQLGAHPPITTTLTQAPGEASTKTATITLPPVFSPDAAALAAACSADTAAAGQCPPTAALGTATVQTPLLPIPLTGPVYLVKQPGQPLPGLEVDLGPIVSIKLQGTFGITGDQRITSTFDGIPDVPITSFQLALTSGLATSKDLCTVTAPPVDGAFADHNGRQAADSAIATVVGCAKPPTVKLALRGVKHRTPTLSLGVRQPAGAPDLTAVTLALPKGLKGNARSAKRGAKGKAARKLARKAVKVAKGSVKAKLPKGARSLKLTLSRGALRAVPAFRRKRGHKVAFKLKVTDAAGQTTPVTMKVKLR